MKLKNVILTVASIFIATPVLAETNKMEETKMKPVEIVANYFEYLISGDLESLGELFDENIVWNQPGKGQLSGVYKGKKQVFALFGEFMSRSNGTFKIDEVNGLMVNGNLVVANLNFSASKDGGSISMGGVDLMKVENGKIIEVHLFSEDQAAEDEFWNKSE